jgi:hypothetical protein
MSQEGVSFNKTIDFATKTKEDEIRIIQQHHIERVVNPLEESFKELSFSEFAHKSE